MADGRLVHSPTDVAAFLGCEHRIALELQQARGERRRPFFPDPTLELLRRKGEEHERAWLARRKAETPGLTVVEIDPAEPWDRAAARTREALARGVDLVYQATFFDGARRGRADFLEKVPVRSPLGAWSYVPIDTKLARETKARAIVQLCVYAELLEATQGLLPEWFGIVLGDGALERFRTRAFLAYVRAVEARFADALGGAATEPDPVPECDVCDWWPVCDAEWRAKDHLSLVAGISRRQRRALVDQGVATVEALAALPPARLREVDAGFVALERVREQARVQVEGRRRGAPYHELLPAQDGKGLAILPAPSPGDLFFDIEGDPYGPGGPFEYLFGLVDVDDAGDGAGPAPRYRGLWAHTRADERRIFEELVDEIMSRRERWPGAHVYHFAAYEQTALKRLAGAHATRQEEIDRLLRARAFVDLHRVVRQGVRASVESYSIKKLEPIYGFRRAVDLRVASASLRAHEVWLESGAAGAPDPDVLARIEGYNRDDCLSAHDLRAWLEERRRALEAREGRTLSRPAPGDGAPSDDAQEVAARVRPVHDRLLAGLPTPPETAEQHARFVLAHLLEWHRREEKSMWWEYYRMLALTPEEMIEDRTALGGLKYQGVLRREKQSYVHAYGFPEQEHGIAVGRGDVHDPATAQSAGKVTHVDDERGVIHLKRGIRSAAPHPAALVPQEVVRTTELRERLLDLGMRVAQQGLAGRSAALDLLLRRPPRARGLAPGTPVVAPGEPPADAVVRAGAALDRSILPVQGPPGSGKTSTAARLILEILAAGRRVGITANSHQVISNLLRATCQQARDLGRSFRAVQKCDEEDGVSDPLVRVVEKPEQIERVLARGAADLVAGTAWLWARPGLRGAVDTLVVDEAGQIALANVLACAHAATNLVLVGDPQQLEQPTKGVHPDGVGVSALGHLLGPAATMPPELGVLLSTTYRLHPSICEFTSEVFYEGKLEPAPECTRRTVVASARLGGSGLRFVPVPHAGNSSASAEEASAIAALVAELLAASPTFVDERGRARPLVAGDVLVITPYNAQVRALRAALPIGVRVGTVDKFQGQQAPIAIYSMATSTPEDAPRGMEFLYSLNRLNVATSRAQALAVVVASPALLYPNCRTPRQMELANALCRFAEMATRL